MTKLFMFIILDTVWTAQTGEQWASQENGRRSSIQESRLGTAEVTWYSCYSYHSTRDTFVGLVLPCTLLTSSMTVCLTFTFGVPVLSRIVITPWGGLRVFPEDFGCSASGHGAFVCWLYKCLFSDCSRQENQKLKELVTGSTVPADTAPPEAREEPVKDETTSVRSKMEVGTPQKVNMISKDVPPSCWFLRFETWQYYFSKNRVLLLLGIIMTSINYIYFPLKSFDFCAFL